MTERPVVRCVCVSSTVALVLVVSACGSRLGEEAGQGGAPSGLPQVEETGPNDQDMSGTTISATAFFASGPLMTAVQVSFWPGSSFETKCSQASANCLFVHGTLTR